MKTPAFIVTVALLMASAEAATAAPAGSFEVPAADWVLVQNSGAMKYDGKSVTLENVSPQTILFTDRPQRMSGTLATEQFIKDWGDGKDSFAQDPPNASLAVVVDGKEQISVVELTNPKLSGTSLTYDVRVLEGTVPAQGTSTALFIDWWYGPWGGVCHYGPYGGTRCWRP